MAAEFVNQDRKLRAVYFVDAHDQADYYADNGTRMRKAFLRTPVNFTRISSNFNLQRRHPVLNTIRAHRGVDYAAPHGTPIKATASGKVLSVGTSGGYGKAVKLQHGGSIATMYAHMSRFARGLKVGDNVKQGQTIGYVGQTGLATGPHLHYEFLVNGTHRNPLTVELPKAEPVPNEMIDEFRSKTSPLLAQLDSLANERARGSMIASRKPVAIPIR
jgi:murein DD-endopeptidase MepM/ murein hydrolase activator NlpD